MSTVGHQSSGCKSLCLRTIPGTNASDDVAAVADESSRKTSKPSKRPRKLWQFTARYLRRKNTKRLKPNQIEGARKADGFSTWLRRPLNYMLTVHFKSSTTPEKDFELGKDRLSKFLRRNGWEFYCVYVWEATNGFHVHCMVHLPSIISGVIVAAIQSAFAGADVDVRRRWDRHGAQAYLLKGTDAVTHAIFFGRCRIKPKQQGEVP